MDDQAAEIEGYPGPLTDEQHAGALQRIADSLEKIEIRLESIDRALKTQNKIAKMGPP